MRAVDLVGVQLEPNSATLVVLLQERDEPGRVLPLFVGGPEASAIAVGATGTPLPRPLTHDVMATLVEALGAEVERVEVTALDGATFFADLVVAGPGGELRVDSRPSDAIALAVRTHAPLFVSDEVMDRASAVIEEENEEEIEAENETAGLLEPEAIEAEVDEFRDFLADLDPEDFATPPSD